MCVCVFIWDFGKQVSVEPRGIAPGWEQTLFKHD